MKSRIEPICASLREKDHTASEKGILINQYVSTCEIDHEYIKMVTQDPNFPEFIQLLFKSFNEIKFDENLNSTYNELATKLVGYFSTLALTSPFLLNTIAANAHLDVIIPNIFESVKRLGDIRHIEATKVFPFLKFIAILSSSKDVSISSPSTLATLHSIIFPLVGHPQLAAWINTIYGFLSRNSPISNTFINTQQNLLQLKREMTVLLSSNDECVVCAALSAYSTLFSIGSEADSSIRAAVNFMAADTRFPLMKQLAGSIILDNLKKTRLDSNELIQILKTLITTNGFAAYSIIQLLVNLTDYYGMLSEIIRSTNYIGEFILFLATAIDDFVSVAGCHLLLVLTQTDNELLDDIPNVGLFQQVFDVYLSNGLEAPPDRFEATLILLRLVLQNSDLEPEEIQMISDAENTIFTGFLRNVEHNNAYLTVCYFLFITECIKYIPAWTDKTNRIVFESQFVPLVISVITSSLNKSAIRDALTVMRHFLVDEGALGAHLFESFASGFHLVNRNATDVASNAAKESIKKRVEYENSVRSLSNDLQVLDKKAEELDRENKDLREQIEKEHALNDEMKRNYSMYKQKSIDLEELNESLMREIKKTKDDNRILQQSVDQTDLKANRAIHQNTDITQQLTLYERSDRDKQSQIEKLEKQLRETQYQNQSLRNQLEIKDNDLSTAQMQFAKAEKRATKAEESLRNARTTNKKLVKLAEKLKKDVYDEQLQSHKLGNDIIITEQQNQRLLALKKDYESMKQRYTLKREEYRKRIETLEKERNKWESIAKFSNRVKECKFEAAQEVYKPLF